MQLGRGGGWGQAGVFPTDGYTSADGSVLGAFWCWFYRQQEVRRVCCWSFEELFGPRGVTVLFGVVVVQRGGGPSSSK